MDISYCDDKTGFPRPGHIFPFAAIILLLSNFKYPVASLANEH